MADGATIQQHLSDYPWLQDSGRDCVLSPDCDGFLCGLFMSFFFDWKVRGYYDGKALFVEQGVDPKECVFLDMEIARPHVKSVGQHMLYYQVDRSPHPDLEKEFASCLSPNNLRKFDFYSRFMRKYPLGTIHLLMALLPQRHAAGIGEAAPLFYVDGVFKNLLNYPENCLDWLAFLDAENNVLGDLFHGSYPFSRLMTSMRDFFALLDGMKTGKQRPDKLPLLEDTLDNGAIAATPKERTEKFLRAMGELTGWSYQPEKWAWSGYRTFYFTKGSVKPTLGRFQAMAEERPLSWAITSRASVEYTLDNQGVF